MATIKLAIHGAAGRMGQRLLALGSSDAELSIVAAVERAEHPKLGTDAGILAGVGNLGVPLSSTLGANVDIVIDYSMPESAAAIADECVQRSIGLVEATTGLSEAQEASVRFAATSIPIVRAPNTSLAVTLVMKLSEVAALALKDHPSGTDVEIVERHHRFKEDAPSGTALAIGKMIAAIMGQRHEQHGRKGRPGQRQQREIGYHAVRAGDHPGEHSIVFGLLGETVELRVSAINRDCYAHGALAAAKFLAGKPAGLYGMNDVLGLK